MSTIKTNKVLLQSDNTVRSDALHFLESQTASSSASLDFVLPSGYWKYEFVMSNIVPATDFVAFRSRISTDAGSTWLSTSNYHSAYTGRRMDSSADGVANEGSATSFRLGANDHGSDTSESMDANWHLINPGDSSSFTRLNGQWNFENSSGAVWFFAGGGVYAVASAVDAIQFYFSSGNIESGTIKMYGWVDSA